MEEESDSISMDRKTAEYVIRAERLKRSITIFDAIRYLGIEDKVKTLETSSSIACPFHGQDMHPSATIYSDSNMFFCHKCSSYPMDVISFVSKVSGISKTQALSNLEEFAGLPPMEIFREPEEKPAEEKAEDKNGHKSVEDRIREKLAVVRGRANLSQYIKLWQYFDHLQFHFKDFGTLNGDDYSEHLTALDRTLNQWLDQTAETGEIDG